MIIRAISLRKTQPQIAARRQESFYDYSLPVAILRLKQALGRTIRHQEQQSAVVILDNRMLTKRYGRQIQTALEKIAPISVTSMKKFQQKLSNF